MVQIVEIHAYGRKKTCLFFIDKTVTTDDLVTWGARTSADMVLIKSSQNMQNIPV